MDNKKQVINIMRNYAFQKEMIKDIQEKHLSSTNDRSTSVLAQRELQNFKAKLISDNINTVHDELEKTKLKYGDTTHDIILQRYINKKTYEEIQKEAGMCATSIKQAIRKWKTDE